MALKTLISGATNVAGNWSPSGVPGLGDDIVIPSGVNGNIPTSATLQCRSFTADSGSTFTMNASSTMQVGTSTPGTGNVAISISSGCTWTASGTIQLVSTSATQQTILTGGKTLPLVTQSGVGSSYLMLDAWTSSTFTLTGGTFDTGSYTWTINNFAASGSNVKTLTLGSSVVTCTSGNTPFSTSGSNFTITSNTATLRMTPSANQVQWGGVTSGFIYNVENNPAVVGSFLSTGFTCQNFTFTGDASQLRTLQLSGNLNCLGTFTVTSADDQNRILVLSSALNTKRVINAASWSVTNVDWMDIAAINTTAGSTFTSDSFNRANGAIGTSDAAAGGSAQAWTAQAGSWNVVSNAANIAAGAGVYFCTVPVGSQDVSISAKFSALQTGGLVARYLNAANHIKVRTDAGANLQVDCVSGGVVTTLSPGVTYAANDVITMQLHGSAIRLLKNGTQFYATAGAFVNVAGGGTAAGLSAQGNATYDDFKVEVLNDVPITSGVAGDCQGNSGIVFTASATQTRNGSNVNWTTHSSWTSRVPLPQDDVIFNAGSAATTSNLHIRLGRNIDFTGFTGTINRTSITTPYALYGSLTMSAGMNQGSNPNTMYVEFRGRNAAYTVTTAGLNLFQTTTNQRLDFFSPGGSYTFLDDLTYKNTGGTNGPITAGGGLLDMGAGLTHEVGSMNATGSTLRTLNLNSSTYNFYTTSAVQLISLAGTNVTLQAAQATCNLTSATNNVRTFNMNSQVLGTINYMTADSAGPIAFFSTCSVENLNVGSATAIRLPANSNLFVKNLTASGVSLGYQLMQGMDGSNLMSAPDAAPLQIANDITVEVKLRLPSYNSGSQFAAISKLNAASTAGWGMRITAAGVVQAFAGATVGGSTVSLSTVLTAGQVAWVRYQRVKSTGVTKFYTSVDDGATWQQLGANVTIAANVANPTTTDLVYIGSRATANDMQNTGRFYRARVYADATVNTPTNLVADWDAQTKTIGANTIVDSVSGYVVSIPLNMQQGDGRVTIRSATPGTQAHLVLCGARTSLDQAYPTDIFSSIPDKFYIGSGVVGSNCANIQTGVAPATGPYVKQFTEASGVAFPFAVTAGNKLVAAITSTTASPAWATPAGYSVIARSAAAGPAQVESYERLADGSETSFTTTTTGGAVSAKCYEIVGADTVDVIGENSGAAVTNLDASAAPLTTYGGETLGIALWGGNTIGVSGAVTDGYGEIRLSTLASHFRAAIRTIPPSTSTNPNFSWTGNQNPRSQLLVFKATAAAPSTNRGVLTGAAGIGF